MGLGGQNALGLRYFEGDGTLQGRVPCSEYDPEATLSERILNLKTTETARMPWAAGGGVAGRIFGKTFFKIKFFTARGAKPGPRAPGTP